MPVDRILVPIDVDDLDVKSCSDGTSIVRELWRCEKDPQQQLWKQLLGYLLEENHLSRELK
jgi:hypothetical protein